MIDAISTNIIVKHIQAVVIALVACVLVVIFSVSLRPQSASADASDAACQGLTDSLGANACGPGTGTQEIDSTLATVINVLSMIVGVIAIFMIIIAGIRYITSNGDPNSAASARNTVIYTMVGLVIVVMAQVIVRFVIARTNDAGAGGGVPPPYTPPGPG